MGLVLHQQDTQHNMLSPARKILWKARREQRKHKLKLATITEEDETVKEEIILPGGDIDMREEPDMIIETSDKGTRFKIFEVQDILKDTSDLAKDAVKRREKANLLFLLDTQPQNTRVTCTWQQPNRGRNKNIKRDRTFFRQSNRQMKIPRKRTK